MHLLVFLVFQRLVVLNLPRLHAVSEFELTRNRVQPAEERKTEASYARQPLSRQGIDVRVPPKTSGD